MAADELKTVTFTGPELFTLARMLGLALPPTGSQIVAAVAFLKLRLAESRLPADADRLAHLGDLDITGADTSVRWSDEDLRERTAWERPGPDMGRWRSAAVRSKAVCLRML